MVNTIKFSQFPTAALGDSSRTVAGVATGENVLNPLQNTWTTSTRPISPFDGLMGYNTTISNYEFWQASTTSWVQFTVS